MGSFNCTCIVSGLPIEAGTKVRFLALARSAFHPEGNDHVCYVSGRWQLHGVPIRGQYNDYGTVEVEGLDDSLTTRLFFEGLKRSSVEKGVGDNTCHDVEVRHDMDRKGWLEALWEGRVEVDDQRLLRDPNWDPDKYEPPTGVPSIKRIQKVLTDRSYKVSVDRNQGYLVDELVAGYVRIRWGSYERGEDQLKGILPAIHEAGYAAMITVGSGSYSNQAELLVAPLPPTDPNQHIHVRLAPKLDYQKPRPVSQAMIREDVWEILRTMTVTSWIKDYTSEQVREDALKALAEERAMKARLAEMSPEDRFMHALMSERYDDRNLFKSLMWPHEGMSGYTLKEVYQLALSMERPEEELQGFLQDLADTLYVQASYASLYGQWHPSTNGSQDGNWEAHREFRRRLLEIKGVWEEELDEENELESEEEFDDSECVDEFDEEESDGTEEEDQLRKAAYRLALGGREDPEHSQNNQALLEAALTYARVKGS